MPEIPLAGLKTAGRVYITLLKWEHKRGAAILWQPSFLLNAICMACSFVKQQQADFTETSERFIECHRP